MTFRCANERCGHEDSDHEGRQGRCEHGMLTWEKCGCVRFILKMRPQQRRDVIFLDIDGVLNRGGTEESMLNRDLVLIFRRILAATGASVVISSSWKYSPALLDLIRAEVCDFADCTPHIPAEGKDHIERRGIEIQAWLDAHPETGRYAIVDDAHESFMLEPQRQNFFKTDGHRGLTDEIAEKIIDRFKR